MDKAKAIVFAVSFFLAILPQVSWAQEIDPNGGVALEDLVTGAVPSVTVGDKNFSMFTYSYFGDMPAAADVNVLDFLDGDGNFGLTFQGAFRDEPGGDPNGSYAILEFKVTVSDEGQQKGNIISDAHLFLSGSGVEEDSEFRVDEEFDITTEKLSVYDSDLIPGQQLSDWVYFDDPSLTANVLLKISAFADPSAILPARATAIDVSFSQIPEPSSLVMLILAAGTIPVLRRK